MPELRSVPAHLAHAPFHASDEKQETGQSTASPRSTSHHLSVIFLNIQAEDAQLQSYGVVLGRDYPLPIISSLDNGRLPLKVAGGAKSAAFDKGKKFDGPKWMKEKADGKHQ